MELKIVEDPNGVTIATLDKDLAALKRTLLLCDDNIKIFEDAIAKEMETKAEHRQMIQHLEVKREKLANDSKKRNLD